MAPKPPPPPSTLTLRGDRDPHPGKPDKARTKRTTAEVQRDKAVKMAEKTAAAAKKKDGIDKAARVEDKLEAEDRANERDGNHPPPTTITKTLRPRPAKEASTAEQDPSNAVEGADPFSDGPGSSDEFHPNAEDILDLSDEDTAAAAAAKPEPKKKGPAKKGLVRQAVQDARAKTSAPESAPRDQGKRKDRPVDAEVVQPPVTKKSRGTELGGLRTEYRRGRTTSSSQMSHRSKSASSAMSVDLVSENGSVPASEYEDSSEGMGGFASDGDDGEEVTWAKERDQQKVGRKLENLSKIHSLAGIVETDAPGLVALRPVKSEGKLKKANIRLRDLPQSLQADFGKIFTPELLRYTGTLPPWQNIDSWAELAELWDPLFPEYTLADDEQLQAVVLKLADDKVTAWRNKFSAAAIEALDALYASWKAYSPEARADVVAWLLQGNDTNRAFYYREYADSEENVVQKGLFQGYLITCGLAAHYTAIRSAAAPIEDPETAEFPETPLVYAIQAAKRALNYSVTGKLVVPGQRLGEFSKANWGDKMDFREGRQVVVNTASSLVAIARKLEDKPQLQKKIMIAAIEASLPKRRAGGKTEVIEIDAGSPTEDIELVDNDSD